MSKKHQNIEIYTDGSCHTKLKIGAWAAMLLFSEKKIELSGKAVETTNNRMELTAVIESIKYLIKNNQSFNKIKIYTDSQYAEKLSFRKEKLKKKNFITKKGTPIQNVDLVKILIQYIENYELEFIKVKAHQKKTNIINYNIVVDKLCRKIVRQTVKELP